MDQEKMLKLFQNLGNLKQVQRQGWLRCGVNDPESVADHTYGTAVISMVLGDIMGLDTEKMMRMALLHDLPEILTGDITPYDEITSAEKHEKEKTAINSLFNDIPNGNRYISLWQEYENGDSAEAVVVRNIDKFEMALQAKEYQKNCPEDELSEFFNDVEKSLIDPEIKKLYYELTK